MDISINQIDLEYLTNYSYEHHFNKPKKNDVYYDDLEFYKIRIFKLTKDLLRGNESSIIIKESFHAYINTAIKSFKFEDETEILQEEFKDLEEKKKKDKTNKEFKSIESDKLMMKDLKQIIVQQKRQKKMKIFWTSLLVKNGQVLSNLM